tara:strand:+ start:374 stop:1324 length:951 start_codon:yes stop_codon:yes gene_type:complete
MKNKMRYLLVVLFSVFYTVISAQNAQPSMMVIPYTKSGESALDKFESDKNFKALIAGIEQAIIDRGGELQDLETMINNCRKQMTLEATKYKDITDAVLSNAKSEITIAADIDYHDDGKYVQFGITLKAVETSTGNVFYPGTYFSAPTFPRDANFQDVATNLLNYDKEDGNGVYIEKFMNGMQAKFNKMVKEGKSIKVIILTDDRSEFRLNDDADDDFNLISDLLKTWVKTHAFNNVYRLGSSTDNRMEFDMVKIPMRTADGMPYATDDFATDIKKGLLRICQNASKTMGDGSKVDPRSTQMKIDKGTIMLTMPSFR